MPPVIAYLSRGKLHLKDGVSPARNVESAYGETIRERLLKSQQRHSWKSGGAGGRFLSGSMLWGKHGEDAAPIHVELTSLCSGNVPGHLLYTLESQTLCGLLSLENLGEYERRLWNNNQLRIRHLSLSPDGDLACGIENKNGTSNIGLMLHEKSGLSEVTEGDSFDSAPSWIPGKPREIVFHSAGVGRTKDGQIAGLGAFHIQKLVLSTGEMTTLLEDPGYDFLAPRMTADGTLYCIQRPHQKEGAVSPVSVVKDVILLPFRLLWAVLQFLNYFSMLFGAKKLTPSATGPAQTKQLDPRQVMLWGNLVQAQSEGADENANALVPRTWKLIRKRDGHAPETVARGVACFDIDADGAIAFSNGAKIISLKDNKETTLGVGEMIEQIAIVPS